MEWKIIVGQVCLTAVAISCIVTKTDSGLVFAAVGALATSIGVPALLAAKKQEVTE